MEVHYHPGHHAKKGFARYLSEFVMIFLAVTLGFLAESFREHLSDTEREKQYISSFLDNLRADTASIRTLLQNREAVLGVDTLLSIKKNNFKELAVQDSLYYYSIRYLSSANTFRQNDLTIIQLRNAGGYRLIRKGHVADSIAVYEQKNEDLKSQEAFYLHAFSDCYNYFNQTFDWSAINHFFSATNRSAGFPSERIPVLITSDQHAVDQYYNQVYELDVVFKGYLMMLQKHLIYFKGLMSYLQREYDL